MFAVSLALVAQEFPAGPERGMAMGIYGATIGIAVAIGPLVGGLLTDGFGWEWVFLINVPIGIAAIAVTYWKLAESRDPNATRIDWGGLLTFSSALFLLVLGLVRGNDAGWGSPTIVSLLVGAGVLMAAFAAIEQRVARADAAALALPPPRLHRRAAGRLRGLRLDVRAVPLPDALPAELPRLLADRRRPALPADHDRLLHRRAAGRPGAGQGPGPLADERRPGADRRRPAADGRSRRRLRVDRAAGRLRRSAASASACSTR